MQKLLPTFVALKQKSMKRNIFEWVFNEYTLMGIAVLGAFYLGEYVEGVTVIAFYLIGEWFQDRAVDKAKRNIKALLDVRPKRVDVVGETGIRPASPADVKPGDVMEVKVGERVPLDGVLMADTASFNTSALTGESVPRTLHADDEVLAGMIVENRVVRIRATKPYDQSALARILALVQDAASRKAPTELFIRRFARIYTPVVILLALLLVVVPYVYGMVQPTFAYCFDEWFYRALIFLVVSCPCALVVSIPLGYFGGIGAASSQGILFKGGNYLDAITRINTVVFDKTGTLTRGTFDVQEVHPEGVSEEELMRTLASVESYSNHPIAKAILAYSRLKGVQPERDIKVAEVAGYGMRTEIGGQEVLVGNIRLLEKEGIAFPAALTSIPETTVACSRGGRYIGYVTLSDTPKEDARAAVDSLKQLKVDHIEMLSGDKQAIVSKLANALGIRKAFGDLLPEGKVAHMELLKQDTANKVAFVGDGINDTPVLALADVGIAIGGKLGSDAAIETADVVIQSGQPSKVATAIRLGRLTHRIVWQNIALAFGVKLIVLALGAGGMATLWEAIFADVGVALLAILNAIRIQKKIL